MHGETVTIKSRTATEADPFNDPTYSESTEQVDNVLVAQGSQSNSTDSTRPDGVQVAFTLYFPRSWAYRSLKGDSVLIDGNEYKVVGNPRPYDGGLHPTQWNLEVEVSESEG